MNPPTGLEPSDTCPMHDPRNLAASTTNSANCASSTSVVEGASPITTPPTRGFNSNSIRNSSSISTSTNGTVKSKKSPIAQKYDLATPSTVRETASKSQPLRKTKLNGPISSNKCPMTMKYDLSIPSTEDGNSFASKSQSPPLRKTKMSDASTSLKHDLSDDPCNHKPKENVYAEPSRKPGPFARLGQRFQIHTIQHPKGFLAKAIMPTVRLFHISLAKPPKMRLVFGPNFCNQGNLVLTDWDENVKALTTMPQARTYRHRNPKKMPGRVRGKGERNLFLLTLSQKGAGGDGMHEACRETFIRYIIAPAMIRQKDSVAKSIIAQCVEDYKSMQYGAGGKFFTDKNFGMHLFMNQYLHYCLYGISPSDTKKLDILYKFHYANPAQFAGLYYVKIFGPLYNLMSGFKFNRFLPEVAKIYEESPAIAAMPKSVTSFKLSRNEVAHLTIPIMAIAATLGPKTILAAAMGKQPLPNAVKGARTDKIDICKIWDDINLDDSTEVEKYLCEVSRLIAPVPNSHYVTTEEITVEVLGKERTFPKGTSVMIPFDCLMIDKNVWGESANEFDLNRRNLVEHSMVFNSVGDQTNGRVCPGKGFTLNMMKEIIVKCGKARREMKAKG